MNATQEIAKVHAGLRNCKAEPDAWLFVDGDEDWTWDLPEMAGKPVFHAPSIRTMHEDRGDPCPWVMLFASDNPDANRLNARFFDGYDQHQPT